MSRDPGMDRVAELLSAMQRLVTEPGAERAFAEDPRGFLARVGDVDGLAELGARRLFIYRRHVRKVLARGIRKQIPRAAARLGAAFEAWVDRWIEADPPRSRYFRDAAFEMVAWAVERWDADPSLPSFLGDLARHELVQFEVGTTPASAPGPEIEIALDRGVRFDAAVRLARYAHAVERLSEDLDARDEAPRAPTAILVYRDEDHDARFLSLTPLAAAILERLLAGATLREAVVGGAAAIGSPVDDTVTAGTARLLEDLRERGALLGGAAA